MKIAAADWERLRPLLDEAPVVIFMRDPEGRYLYVNRSFEALTGREAADVVGRGAHEVLPPEAARFVLDTDREAMQHGRAVLQERIGMYGDQRRRYTAFKFPLLDAAGKPLAVVGFDTDVTDRRRTEEALQSAALAVSSARGDRIFQELTRFLAAILRCELALVGQILPGEPRRVRTLGVYGAGGYRENFEYLLDVTPCREVARQGFFLLAEGVAARYPQDSALARLGATGYAGYPLADADGRIVGILAILSQKPLVNHGVIESVLKIFAVRAEAELERRAHEAALAASEASYRAIFEASEDGIFVHDPQSGAILEANARACEMFGYGAEELRRATVGELSAPDPAYSQERALALIRRAGAQAEPVRFEWRGRHRGGRLMWHEVTLKAATLAGERRILAFVRDITARKLADEALAASEAQYRAIFNASADALVLWDSSLRRVDVNPAYERIYGWTRDEVVGRAYEERNAPPEYAERRLALVRRSLAGETCRLELESVRRSGERFTAEVTTIPFTHRGEPHVLAIARDVTARKTEEELLRASEAQYRAIFNASADSMVLRDAEFRVVDVNPAYEKLSGRAREEALGRNDLTMSPPELNEHVRALHRRALAGEPVMFEARARRKNGEQFEIETRGVPILHQGRPHVLYIGRDITTRKNAEEVLRASEEQYRAIFNAAADALVLRDEQARIVDVNPAFLEISGYSREEVMNGRHWIFAGPGQQALAQEMFRRVIGGESVQFEVEGRRKDGAPLVVEMRAVPIRYRGRPHALGMARDITQRRALETRVRQAQRMEALGQLTGGVAHDFNNLLAAIMGYVVLASERDAAAADAKLAGYLEQALASSRRARDLIQQMLTFSRGQRGSPRPVDLAEAAAESLKLLRSSLPSTLEIQTRFEAVPPVLIDPVQLDQILMNLAINARDAMAGIGRVDVAVRQSVLRQKAVCASCRKRFRGEFAELAVADLGPGMAAAVLERIFEPFFTTKEVGRGSGMGLATVHGVVHEHGGHILVESAPGAGSRFRVLLPMHAGSAAAGEAKPALQRKTPLRGRVLVVDDERAVADFMRELLESWGMQATTLSSPLGVLERVSREPRAFDLVILDQTMPGMTGVSIARELAAVRPDLPVILYTGNRDRVEQSELAAAGVRALLEKPVEADRLYQVLKAQLG